jgi:hypothetical protein
MKYILGLALVLPLIQAKQLFTLLGKESSRDVRRCGDKFYHSCEKVQLNLGTLMTERTIELPLGLAMSR